MKRWFPGTRPTWIILVSALTISLVATVVVVRQHTRDMLASHEALAAGLSRQLARAGHLALLADDRKELDEITQSVLHTNVIIASVTVLDNQGSVVARQTRAQPKPTLFERAAATAALWTYSPPLRLRFYSQIPPIGEGSPLDPFGTPRADIGRAVLHLSAPQWTKQLAATFYRAALVGLFVFVGLTVTGFAVAWTVARPMSRLGQRLRELSGSEAEPDLEHSLVAIGQRLTRSEDEARRATETLRTREVELERARSHAGNAARLRADMVAGMSHELRAPLSAILGHTELLARGRLNAEQRDHVATVRNSARNLLGVIDDVLEWSGLEAGRTNLDEVGFNLAETVEETVTLLAPLAFEKDLELVHLIYRDVPVHLRGDPLRFQQVLTNLISNAIKFTDRGSVTVRLMLEGEQADSVQLRVSVADTGAGIDADGQVRLFAMYERLQSDSGRAAGSGLGLAISKRLLEMMGGEIHVDSTPGEGSDFYFLLPLKKSLHREEQPVPRSALADTAIWIADDHRPACLALVHQLESWGAQPTDMGTPAAVHAALCDDDKGPPPDVLILGLRAAQARDPELGAILAQSRALGFSCLTLVTSIDRDIHAGLVAAGADRSLAKSSNRMRLHRELCELIGIEEPTQEDEQPLAGLQALVADDSAASRRYVAALLTGMGAGTALAADGEEAVAAWRKGAFRLVILDDRMPNTNGPEAAANIRTLATSAVQPVLIGVTADASGDASGRFLRAGADACLVKPFDEQQVRQRVLPLLRTGPAAAEQAPAQRGEQLANDPQMAALLAQELPEQLAAVEAALEAADLEAGCREIHTLHGTAAFYRLAALKTASAQLEQQLQNGDLPSPTQCAELRREVDAALVELGRRAQGTAAVNY